MCLRYRGPDAARQLCGMSPRPGQGLRGTPSCNKANPGFLWFYVNFPLYLRELPNKLYLN